MALDETQATEEDLRECYILFFADYVYGVTFDSEKAHDWVERQVKNGWTSAYLHRRYIEAVDEVEGHPSV